MTTHDVAAEVLKRDSRERQALAILLDRELGARDTVFVEQTVMGGIEAYLGSMDLSWVARRVGLAQELPLFAEHKSGDNDGVKIDATTIDLVMQRPVDWSRQEVLTRYLATKSPHLFPPIVVVVTADWVEEPGADEWGRGGRAKRSVIDFSSLDSAKRVGLLDVGPDYQIFALDGQHRLIGIRGLLDLVQTGQLRLLARDGKPIKAEPVLLSKLLVESGRSRAEVQAVPRERIGVQFIPAVMTGETREEARERVKSIFVHVNRTAAPLTEGQMAQLDQDNGFALIAKGQAVSHPLLVQESGRKERVNFNNSTIASRATVLTTLQTLKEMAERYLGADERFSTWVPARRREIPQRPSDEALELGTELFGELLDHLAALPSYHQLERGADTGSFRRFNHEKSAGRGHLLFRPIGQIALAQAVGELHLQGRPKLSLGAIFGKLAAFDQAGGFTMDSPSSLWYGVLYDPLKRRMLVSGRDLAARLLRYVVLGDRMPEADRAKLREALIEARRTEDGKVRGFDGREVLPARIQLPATA